MKREILALLTVATIAGAFVSAPVRADDEPGAYFEDQCLDCHHRKKKPLEDKHLSHDEWQKAIDKMIELEKLDPVPSKEFIAKMVDWLTANHGPAGGATAAADAPKSQ